MIDVSDLEFELVVTRRKPNPAFAEHLRMSRENQYYHSSSPPEFLDERALRVVLSPKEFNAVRIAVLVAMEES